MDAEGATRRTRLKRTVKSCGSGAAVLALSWAGRCPAGDGGKRAVLRGEHEVSRKAIAQGRPECSRCPVCSCAVLFAQIARETAGAASTRSSLRPLLTKRAAKMQTSGRSSPREREVVFSRHSPVRNCVRAKRSPSSSASRAMMDSPAPPILWNCADSMTGGRGAAVSKARRPAGTTSGGMEPGPRPP